MSSILLFLVPPPTNGQYVWPSDGTSVNLSVFSSYNSNFDSTTAVNPGSSEPSILVDWGNGVRLGYWGATQTYQMHCEITSKILMLSF